ncbi:MAG: ATP-dependent DNA helicase RecG [Prevotella sp.]|nr:ATP-dependent DNA helicase RecG [Bacteroides sp.]MCM1365984.1 ATP-dependent DNA helicase RecG [Prevotella sp.]MCM1436595.1 ATP-dependent DNA helicase RecG [Prevotella sp.]
MESLENRDVKFIKGVGESRAGILASELSVHNGRDLITYFPFRYVDRSKFYSVREFAGEMPQVQIRGVFVNFAEEGEGAKKRLIGAFREGHNIIEVVWFARIKQIRSTLKIGQEYVLFGKPTFFHNGYQISHPEVEIYDPTRPPEGLRGVYNVTEKMKKRGFTSRTLQQIFRKVTESGLFDNIKETLPPEVVNMYHLMPLGEALKNMHLPGSVQSLQKARERMKFEELMYVQIHILRFSRERNVKIAGHVFHHIGGYFNGYYHNCLPFNLTDAQKRVLREIRADMRTGHQMNRLLQGDVGSGKTMVAFMTMLMALDNGFQAAMMAPTEILATQHYETISEWCRQIGVSVKLLTGSTRISERNEIYDNLQNGKLQILIGTHALIEEKVKFCKLGLAVIDEQHRFGVAQRSRLWLKNETPPHVLVMTATPIPRTLAMTVYGDLDVSVIDELPPGRKPIQTLLRYGGVRSGVDRLINHELSKGRQIYIVYPLISENEKLDLKSLEEGYRQTCEAFPGVNVSCVHGRMKADVKERQMNRFVSGEARILVATTVIEVGVNVPNATVMLINNAERFGLSQLHQLRGRVGRGAEMSYCILMTKQKISKDTRRRLEVMTETNDGFIVAEEDMKLRGPGDIEGTQQSGIAFNFKVADITRDFQIMEAARQAASALLDANPMIYSDGRGRTEPKVVTDLILSQESLGILSHELGYRFSKSIDWSQIS